MERVCEDGSVWKDAGVPTFSAARGDASFTDAHGVETVYSQHLQDLEVALERNLKHVGPVLDDEALHENYAQLRQAMRDRDGDTAERLVRQQFGI